jgi:hypothetical protein
MNLGNLIDFCGNLLDYDPVNDTYREQLVALLNDSQTRLLTDRHWAFAQKERTLKTLTDQTFDVALNNGSAVAIGIFPVSLDPILPGSRYELAAMFVPQVSGSGVAFTQQYEVRYMTTAGQAILDRDFDGVTGVYTVTFKWREVYLPADSTNVMNVSDPTIGIPRKSLFLSKWERDDVELDPDLLGSIEAYLPSESRNIPAPTVPRGVAVVAGAGQGIRTINVYMVNVMAPRSQPYSLYRPNVSAGFESSLSKVATFNLTATQTLEFTPETLNSQVGLYRRYYFTCPEANILAPVRIRNADDEQGLGLAIGVDTVPPPGGMTLKPDLSLNTLESQPFQSQSVRYEWNQSAAYRAINLYPHPSADQDLTVRVLTAPKRMQEDQDSPLIPAAYAQVIAYAALEQLTLKVDNPALSQVYERKKALLVRSLEAKYLGEVPRRIIKGTPSAGWRYTTNPFGTLKFTP